MPLYIFHSAASSDSPSTPTGPSPASSHSSAVACRTRGCPSAPSNLRTGARRCCREQTLALRSPGTRGRYRHTDDVS
eukprot:4200003-Pyramimonas_sp.AAC.1